jgi:cyclase
MNLKRIFAALDIRDGRVVKGVNFTGMRDIGDPVEAAKAYQAAGIDEIALLDINATHEKRGTLLGVVTQVAAVLRIPFTVSGGVRNLDDIAALLEAGADKVGVGSAALADPSLIACAADRFGSRRIGVTIDAKCDGASWVCYTHGGRTPTPWDALAFAREAERRGAGEIILNSMNTDGTKTGFDIALTQAVADAVNISVVASSGAGTVQHFVDVFTQTRADAALGATVFHDGLINIIELKRELNQHGFIMR